MYERIQLKQGWANYSMDSYLAESIKDVVEEQENWTTSDFDDIVQRLAGVVANTAVGVKETRQHWLHQVTYIVWWLLNTSQYHIQYI